MSLSFCAYDMAGGVRIPAVVARWRLRKTMCALKGAEKFCVMSALDLEPIKLAKEISPIWPTVSETKVRRRTNTRPLPLQLSRPAARRSITLAARCVRTVRPSVRRSIETANLARTSRRDLGILIALPCVLRPNDRPAAATTPLTRSVGRSRDEIFPARSNGHPKFMTWDIALLGSVGRSVGLLGHGQICSAKILTSIDTLGRNYSRSHIYITGRAK